MPNRSAQFGDNLYGTSKQTIEEQGAKGKIVVLDIEMEGVKQIKATGFPARYVFIAPPSEEVLEKRLRGRGTDNEASILKRLAQAKLELEFAKTPGVHDKIIVNNVSSLVAGKGLERREADEVLGSGGGVQGAGGLCLRARGLSGFWGASRYIALRLSWPVSAFRERWCLAYGIERARGLYPYREYLPIHALLPLNQDSSLNWLLGSSPGLSGEACL
jgi:hypothetical protein